LNHPRLDMVWVALAGPATNILLALAAFDDRHAFAPTEHIWLSAKMDWVRLNDDLPQYQEGPPS
jgi:hypothetical protein